MRTAFDCQKDLAEALGAHGDGFIPRWEDLVDRVGVLYASEHELRRAHAQAVNEITIMRKERDRASAETAQRADSELLAALGRTRHVGGWVNTLRVVRDLVARDEAAAATLDLARESYAASAKLAAQYLEERDAARKELITGLCRNPAEGWRERAQAAEAELARLRDSVVRFLEKA